MVRKFAEVTTVVPMSKQMTASDPLVWIDCEMTGLDQSADALTEVAVVVTDYEPKPLTEGIDVLIKPLATVLKQAGDYVHIMHTPPGLPAALEDGVIMETVRSTVLDYMTSLVPEPRTVQFAGNSVSTDKALLARDMPELIEHLHYQIVDVSFLKELAKHWCFRALFHVPKRAGGRCALVSILESIDELHYYREILFPAGGGPNSQEYKDVAERILNTPIRRVGR